MANSDSRVDLEQEELRPLWLPTEKLSTASPMTWLQLAWQDVLKAPRQSLTIGFGVTLFGLLLTYLSWTEGHTTVLFGLITGFILVGPALAFGLYSISRQLEMGLTPRLGYCIKDSKTHLRNEMLFALLLLVILLIWARAASMVHVFFPMDGDITWVDWLEFLAIGSAVGSIFAGLVFTISAISLPLMLDRNEDAITAALTSTQAVLGNKLPMLVWALAVFGLTVVGLATIIGMVIVFPLLGHASWHAYREAVKVERD